MNLNHLVEQADNLHTRLAHKTNSLIDEIGCLSSVPRSYYFLIARVEDVRANAFNRLCRRQGKPYYRYYKKSDFKTDGLGLLPVSPSVALG